ncbi:MAG: Type 1 glutamine amidotransferase-like domain-containing protein [Desulfosarcinaceae bacterium]|nr:Type 1 glutamine amidotransferase-like domain-containing protein [Desulfosarcinaceae bacterium]
MSGYLLLSGGAEFGGRMADPDRAALAAAGGPEAPVAIIPAAAAPDRNDQRAGDNGVRWFRQLGARQVHRLGLVDRASADDPAIAAHLEDARLIYLLGGFPGHLAQSLTNSRSWTAMLAAYRKGAVIAGSSAGAMVMCDHYYDPGNGSVALGLGLIQAVCVLPHHDTFGHKWAPRLQERLPNTLLMGIDEETGALFDATLGVWRVYGKGAVTLYRENARTDVFESGRRFTLEETDLRTKG